MGSLRRTVRNLSLVLTPLVLLATALTSHAPNGVKASSHREAPLIANDPEADNTDTYAFVSPDNPNTVTLIANYIPLEWPEGGPNWHQFSDDVLYEIHIDNVGDAKPHITYQFQFKTFQRSGETFLYNTGPVTSLEDPNLNVYQRYSVKQITRVNGQTPVTTTLGMNLPTPPVNIGPKSTPNYEANLGQPAVRTIGTNVKVFTGQRDDPFFVDLGAVFDLLSLRGEQPPVGYDLGRRGANIPQDGVAGYNTHTIALQVPTSQLLAAGRNDPVIGVWATASRRSTRVLNGVGGILSGAGAETHTGPYVQVSRLGMPLVNEVVIPRALKDAFNNLKPEQDFTVFQGAPGIPAEVSALLRKSVLNPELQRLLKALYGVENPTDEGPKKARNDILAIFLTGMKTTREFTIQTKNGPMKLPAGFNVNQPKGAGDDGVRPSEMLRLNTAIKGDLCKPQPDYQLGLLGGDACGFPNGRRLQDDVTDIELLAVAGAAYNVLTTGETFNFNTGLIDVLRDNVYGNDRQLQDAFPYVATPHQGTFHEHAEVYSSFIPVTRQDVDPRRGGLQDE